MKNPASSTRSPATVKLSSSAAVHVIKLSFGRAEQRSVHETYESSAGPTKVILGREDGERGLGQKGAMFGLDARIALAIFGILSLVAGTAIVINLNDTRAKSLATELADTGHAVEALATDLNGDIFPALSQPSEKNAFTALYDNSVITEDGNLRSKWLGPYIKYTSSVHPRYGDMLLQARAIDHNASCTPDADCYLWLVYGHVPMDIAEHLNTLLDADHETNPSTTGRVQWTTDRTSAVLYYRAAKTISYTGN